MSQSVEFIMFVQCFCKDFEAEPSIFASNGQLNGGKEHSKETGDCVFGPHRREPIGFLHVLHQVSCFSVLSSSAERISAAWSYAWSQSESKCRVYHVFSSFVEHSNNLRTSESSS